MIALVSTVQRERVALSALCESRGWLWIDYDSLRTFKRSLRTARPAVVVVRHRLGNDYSDDVIAALQGAGIAARTKLVVLAAAALPSGLEARQIALGADLVMRDPVRMEVLVEYLQKFSAAAKLRGVAETGAPCEAFKFAGASVHPIDRTLVRGNVTHHLTPREVELIELLAQAPEQLVSYETLFSEILGRRFRGDTSNLRVLLGKLADSAKRTGIDLRRWVEVIPKLGYRYHTAPMSKNSRPHRERA